MLERDARQREVYTNVHVYEMHACERFMSTREAYYIGQVVYGRSEVFHLDGGSEVVT
jgi:hypothetical protein